MTRNSELRGIFFDLDDTLIGYSAAERQALAAGCRLAAQRNPAINERALGAAIVENYARGYAYGTPGFASLGTLTVRELRAALTGKALNLLGIDDPEMTGELLDAYAVAERDALRLLPHCVETLRLLHPHFKLGVITNGPAAMQREKLEYLSLTGWFSEIIVDTEFGHPKPEPSIFAHAAQRIGLPPEALLFVGNSLEADVAGACGAGWVSVWLQESDHPLPAKSNLPCPPDYVIRDLAELPTLPPIAQVLNRAVPATAKDSLPA